MKIAVQQTAFGILILLAPAAAFAAPKCDFTPASYADPKFAEQLKKAAYTLILTGPATVSKGGAFEFDSPLVIYSGVNLLDMAKGSKSGLKFPLTRKEGSPELLDGKTYTIYAKQDKKDFVLDGPCNHTHLVAGKNPEELAKETSKEEAAVYKALGLKQLAPFSHSTTPPKEPINGIKAPPPPFNTVKPTEPINKNPKPPTGPIDPKDAKKPPPPPPLVPAN